MGCFGFSLWKCIFVTALSFLGFETSSRSSLCRDSDGPTSSLSNSVPGNRAGCVFMMDRMCSFSQGCRDKIMSEWYGTEGGVAVNQTTAGNGTDSYSVLETPALRLGHVSCVEFRYTRVNALALDVYGEVDEELYEFYHGSRSENHTGSHIVYISIPKGTSKLYFRANGGDLSETAHPLTLQNVAFHTGSCAGPACNFTTAKDQLTTCGWTNTSWEHNSPLVTLKSGERNGTLTTNLLRATPDDGLCLSFSYYMDSMYDILTVYILHLNGSQQALWTRTHDEKHESQGWPEAFIHIRSRSAYKIDFQAERCHNLSTGIALTNLTSEPYNFSHECPPQTYRTEKSLCDDSSTLTSTVTPQNLTAAGASVSTPAFSSFSSTTSPYDTYSPFSHPSTDADTNDGERDNGRIDDKTVAVVVGPVVAVLFLIAVIIVVCFVRRKSMKQGRAEDDSADTNGHRQDVLPNQQGTSDIEMDQQHRSNPAFMLPDGDYAEMNEIRNKPSVEAYELAGPIQHREPDTSNMDEYSHLAMHGVHRNTPDNPYDLTEGAVAGGNEEVKDSEEYSHVFRSGVNKKTADDYNRLGRDEARFDFETRNVAKIGSPGGQTDTYNRLTLDPGKTEERLARAGGKVYDHMRDDFQDTYDKAGRERKETVIDSDYDHLTQI